MRQETLPNHVDAQCGQINTLAITPGHPSKRDETRSAALNTTKGERCQRNATRAVKNDDGTVEALCCKAHVDVMRERIEAIE